MTGLLCLATAACVAATVHRRAEGAGLRGGNAGPVEPGLSWTLALDRPLREGDLELLWLDVEDSRCPVSVRCVRSGEVRIRLQVRRADGAVDSGWLELSGRGVAEPTEVSGVWLVLVAVAPRPSSEGDGSGADRSRLRAEVESVEGPGEGR